VGASGVALLVGGFAIAKFGAIIGVVATAVKMFGTVLGMIPTILAALISPIGIVAVALGGLTTALVVYSGYGSKLLAWLGDRFKSLRKDVREAVSGMASALSGGDLQAAAKVLWLLLKLEWIKGKGFLLSQWSNFKEAFIQLASEAFLSFRELYERMIGGLKRSWLKMSWFFRSVWADVLQANQSLGERFATAIAKKMNWVQGQFDATFDVKQANEDLDQQLAETQSDLAEERKRKQEQINADTKAAVKTSEIIQRELLAQYGIEHTAAESARKKKRAEEREAAEKELQQARKNLSDAIAAARGAGGEGEEGVPKPPGVKAPKLPTLDLARLMTAQKAATVGTFGAYALGGLGMGTAAERTAKATEETARNTRDISSSLTFA